MNADIAHLHSDIDEAKQDIRELNVSVSGLRTEFHAFRIEGAKEFGSFRAEVAQRFAAVEARIESVKTSIESGYLVRSATH